MEFMSEISLWHWFILGAVLIVIADGSGSDILTDFDGGAGDRIELRAGINGSGIDFRPTNQQGEVSEILNERLQNAVKQFEQIQENDIQKFNKALEKKNRTLTIEKTGN